MRDKKLTDSEIIKALECCFLNRNCKGCSVSGKPKCLKTACLGAINLINRLQEENERLKNHIQEGIDLAKQIPEMIALAKAEVLQEAASKFAGHSNYHGDTILCILYCMAEGQEVGNAKPIDMQIEVWQKLEKEIKAEAYKEFAERLKEKYPWKDDYLYSTKRISEDIDNLLKEMVGDKNV